MAVLCFCFGFVAIAFNLHVAPHATDIGIDSTAAAGLLSIMNGVSIVGCVLLGALGDKFGNKTMLLFTFLFEGAAMISLVFIDQLWMFYIFVVVYGLAFGSGLAQTSPLVAKLFGLHSLGLILGIITFAQTVGSGLGAYLSGLIYDATGSYFWAFTLCGVLCGLALVSTTFLKPERSSG